MAKIEEVSTARGYWDPNRFPYLADFASLDKDAQNRVAEAYRDHGTSVAIVQLELEKTRQFDDNLAKKITELKRKLGDD